MTFLFLSQKALVWAANVDKNYCHFENFKGIKHQETLKVDLLGLYHSSVLGDWFIAVFPGTIWDVFVRI